jgi:hypothetical protein
MSEDLPSDRVANASDMGATMGGLGIAVAKFRVGGIKRSRA